MYFSRSSIRQQFNLTGMYSGWLTASRVAVATVCKAGLRGQPVCEGERRLQVKVTQFDRIAVALNEPSELGESD